MVYIPPEVVDWWRSDPNLRNMWQGVPSGNPYHPASNKNIIDMYYESHATPDGVVVDRNTVLFLWTGIRLTGWCSQKRTTSIEAVGINHGLASISASLKRAGYKTHLFDLRRMGNWDDFKRAIANVDPLALMIGFHSCDEPDVLEAIKIFKEARPKIPIIVGGVHVTVVRKPILGCTVVFGEGEITAVKLIKMVERGDPLPETVEGETVENLDNLPFIDRGLFDQKRESANPFLPMLPPPIFTINLGRGCYWKKCAFCHESHVTMPKYRVRSPERCITEIARLNPSSIMFHDDIFPPARWCRDFIILWKEKIRRRIPFWCQMRADFIIRNEELIHELSQIGLTWVSLGVESGSQRMLDFLDKGTTVEDNYKAMDILYKNNINVWCNMIFGVPTETKDDVERSVEFLKKTRPYSPCLSTYTCYPNSRLYKYCEENQMWTDEHYSMVRYPYERKVKGIDYDWMYKKFDEIRANTGPLRTYSGESIFKEKEGVKITVIILSHNRPRLMLEAVQSLKDQTFSNWECLVLDDSTSTDEMEKALAEVEKDSRFRIVKVHDTSISRLWNQGVDMAKGQYVCTLDDDNKKYPEYMEKMSKVLDENIQFDAVACTYTCLDEIKGNVWSCGLPDLEHLRDYNTVDGGAIMFRKSIVEKIGWYDERINTSEDWDYNIRIHLQSNGFGIIPEPLSYYRRHNDNRMKMQEQLGVFKDMAFMKSKKYDKPFRVHFYKSHYDTLTLSQKNVINGIEDALSRVHGVEMVGPGEGDITLVPGPFMVKEHINGPIVTIHMEDPYADANIEFTKAHKDQILAISTNESCRVPMYDAIIGEGKTIFCPILGINDVKIDVFDEPKSRDLEIVFFGYPYPSRLAVAKAIYPELSKHKFVFVGDKWAVDFPSEICNKTTNDREAMEILKRAKIVVVSERQAGDCGEQPSDSWHRGYYEAASGAAVVLYCPVPKIHNFGDSVTVTSTIPDLISKIKYLLENPAEAEKKGRLSREKALSTFSYRSRITKLINAVRSQRFFYRIE